MGDQNQTEVKHDDSITLLLINDCIAVPTRPTMLALIYSVLLMSETRMYRSF